MTAWHLALQTDGSARAIDTHAGAIPGRLSTEASAFTVDVFGFGVMGAVLVTAIACALMHFLRARTASAAGRLKAPLAPGQVVLAGEVEASAEPGPVVTLSIEQTGRESQSRNGIVTQLWTETGRRLSVRPFYMVLASGERVRVEPDDRTQLAGRIEQTERLDPASRRRVVEVIPGANITVSGHLEHGHDPGTPGEGYRGSGAGFVLRAPPGGSLRISLASASRERSMRSVFHLRWAGVIALAFVTLHAGLFLHFHLLRMRGEIVETIVLHIEASAPAQTEHSNRVQGETQYFVKAEYLDFKDRHILKGQTSLGKFKEFNSLSERERMFMPFLRVPSYPSIHQAGTQPTLESYKRGVALFFVLIVVFAYGAHAFHTRPWDARRRLVETDRSRL
jgi:hypothetical protein